MPWLNKIFDRRRKLHTLQAKYTQLELWLEDAREDLSDVRRMLGRAQVEEFTAREMLRESELARNQLELDLITERAAVTRLQTALDDAKDFGARMAGRCADLARQLAPFKTPKPRDAKGHFLKETA